MTEWTRIDDPENPAPKDGTPIELWHKVHKCPVAAFWHEKGFPYQGRRTHWLERTFTHSWPEEVFTHWRPLSAPPSDGKASKPDRSVPVSGAALVVDAFHFLSKIPAGVPMPTVAFGTGEITFEWRHEDWAVTASVEGDGLVGYALKRGGRFVPGEGPENIYAETLPADLLDYLYNIKAQRPYDPVEEAVRFVWGERCPDFDPECFTCQAWAHLDKLKKENRNEN